MNVRGFGLLLISGRGHPRIEAVLGIAEHVLDVPIRAVVDGLHLDELRISATTNST